MFFLIWFIIFALLIISVATKSISFWVPIFLYILSVFVRARKVIGYYEDVKRKNANDQKLQIEQKAEEMAQRGMTFSGIRTKEEKRIREDFEFKKRKIERELWVDLVNTLFLK